MSSEPRNSAACIFVALYAMGVGAASGEAFAMFARAPAAQRALGNSVALFLAAQPLALMGALLGVALVLAVRRWAPRVLRGPWLAAALIVAPVAVLVSAALIEFCFERFKNRELTAGLAAVLVVLFTAFALLMTDALAGVARRIVATRPTGAIRRAFPFVPGLLVSGALAWAAAREHATTLRQIDAWLLTAPTAAAATALLTLTLANVTARRPGRRWAYACIAAAVVSPFFALALSPEISGAAARAGAWARPLLAVLRSTTDFDGDGHSGWFGGGDCAPHDAEAHPGAVEKPQNGIDDNCFGGDGGSSFATEARGPSFARPTAWPKKPNLVVVTIETLRADRVSLLGYSKPTTPRLLALAAESAVFERLYATTPTTRLSLAALFSGRLPSRITWRTQGRSKQMRRIGAETPWLPELLRSEGYETIAVHTNFRAFTAEESAGFDRGFTRYDTSTELEYVGGTMRGFPGARQVARALQLLDEHAGRPVFLWLHLVEPHYLYQRSEGVPDFGSDEAALYDSEIAEADRQVGRLLDGLRERGLFEDSVLLVTGDHGEEFGEHGERWHGSNLYDPQVRTAGLLRVPGLKGQRIGAPVSLTDFMPTLLDVLGLASPLALRGAQGRNLLPLLAARKEPPPELFIENFRVDSGADYQVALVAWPYKLLHRGGGAGPELYDLARDAAERENLWGMDAEPGRRLADRLYKLLESSESP